MREKKRKNENEDEDEIETSEEEIKTTKEATFSRMRFFSSLYWPPIQYYTYTASCPGRVAEKYVCLF